MSKFDGKTVFITGAGGYIGNSVAKRFAESGAKVFACDISEEALDRTVSELRSLGYDAAGCTVDVTSSKSVNAAVEQAVNTCGKIDISVHIAGGSARIAGKDARYCKLTEQEDYVIDAVLKVNLYGALYVSRAVARRMIKKGIKGKIINFSSVVGMNGLTNCTEYAAAKGGVIAFTKSFAKEMGEYGITVNSVAPGVVSRSTGEAGAYELETNYLHRRCTADDIAGLTEFLASDDADFITGQTYVIDGGRGLAMKGTD